MGRGLISGLIWGGIVAGIGAVMLSLGTPLPERPAPRQEAVAAQAAPGDSAPADEPADPPAPDDTPGTEGAAQDASGPASEIPLPAGSEFNRPPAETAPVIPGTDTAPAARPQAVTSLPQPAAPPAPEATPAPQPQATVTLEGPGAAPGMDPLGSAPEAGETAPQVPAEQPGALGLPQIETDPEAQTDSAPVGRPLEPIDPAPDAGPDAGAGEAAPAPESPRAIEAFAASFPADETRPLMAVILIDDPSFQLEQEALARFDFPVTFAIDPRRPDASETAAAYRAAGFEVMLLGDVFTEEATGADVPDILARGFDTLPEAVGVLDTAGGAIRGRREILDAVVSALSETGHGLVAFPRGLPLAEQSAARQGVPAATLFREIDSERERATVITRYLDRAAFAAGQDDSAIVVGHTYADTVTALFSWALGDRSEGVALAPVSAVLTR
ncbi:divergent polysaccharide deacetylase family protein [Nioella halotolerans]|uniref:divergent polysaccharide deacetylase family protein n=1 Tax=Nioella halotolerans TaxID=2303578 RepID=UPI0026BDD1D5